jgi:hypothetical protein
VSGLRPAEQRTYFFTTSFICSPQQISEWGMSGGHGHAFSYTRTAPHFSQTYRSPTRRGIAASLARVRGFLMCQRRTSLAGEETILKAA